MAAVFPGAWDSYAAFPFHVGGRPGLIQAELAFWDFLVEEGEALAEGLAGYAVDSFRGDSAEALAQLITEGHSSGVRELSGFAQQMRALVGVYDIALSELRELMGLNKEQAQLHRDGWEAKGHEFEALETQLWKAVSSGDRELYYRIAGELLVVQEEYLRHLREFSTRFDNAVDLRNLVVDLDETTSSRMRRLTDLIDSLPLAVVEARTGGTALEVVEEHLIEAGGWLIDEGLYLQWLPAAVLPLPGEGVDTIAGEQVVASSAAVVEALNRSMKLLSERLQVTGSAMVGAAATFATTDRQSAAALLDLVVNRNTSQETADARMVAADTQAMVSEIGASLDTGRPAGGRLVDTVGRGSTAVVNTADIVTASAAIAESVSAGVPVGEALRNQVVEPMVRDSARELALAKVNQQLSTRVTAAVATSLAKPRLVGRLGHLGVAANVAIAAHDGVQAVRQVRETRRRMGIRDRAGGTG